MYRILCLTLFFLITAAVPAFAEGFSQTQFLLLIVVNLALGAVVTLFLVVLASVLLQKFKAKNVEAPVVVRRTGSSRQVD